MKFLAQVKPSDFDIPKTVLNENATERGFQMVFAILAGIALLILLYAGLKYVLSRGEPAEVAKAKNTILYAVIGLVLSAGAFSIIGFIINRV